MIQGRDNATRRDDTMTQRVALLLDFFIVYSIYHIVSVIRYTYNGTKRH